MDRVKEALSITKKQYHKKFNALSNVSFNVSKGETVGIIGKNGSGKSTLLKMVTGVLTPSSGSVEVSGKISALLELGAGFNGDLSGMENIYLNGILLGYSKEYIEKSIDDILDFADIGDFIHQPVKTYSSGMFVRLAFAIAINIKPEILIVDEALSVGDMRFQQKCYRKIREIKKNGTVLFVSHDTGALANFCDRIIWLDGGKIYKEGKPDEILDEYQAYMSYDIKEMEAVTVYSSESSGSDEVNNKEETNTITKAKAFGNGKAEFRKVALLDYNTNKNVSVVTGGQKVVLDVWLKAKEKIDMPILGFNFKDALGNILTVTNTYFEKVQMKEINSGEEKHYKWIFEFPHMRSGKYTYDIALACGTYHAHEQVQWINDALVIIVKDPHANQEGRGWFVPTDLKLEECN
jgi:ABC-type polysaccharide/polyol phosphate transport system, ATPase component